LYLRSLTPQQAAGKRVPEFGEANALAGFKVHWDLITGAESIFVGATHGIYRKVYDEMIRGNIQWIKENEIDTTFGRPIAMTNCNDTLYCSVDYGNPDTPGMNGGLFKRVDGTKPSWELVYSN
jgi:hypothetical protein